MNSIRLILNDQLSEYISSIKCYDQKTDIILICEVWDEATYVKHHKKKIVFLFSAMRHFSEILKKKGYTVLYSTLLSPKNSGTLTSEVKLFL